MKSIFLIPLFMWSMQVFATNYYVSNEGDDSNDGMSPSNSWSTISRVNKVVLKPGDRVLFRRGDTFYGTLASRSGGKAGAPIVYGAYGSGSRPIITGFKHVNAWVKIKQNLWESREPIADLSSVGIVTINGVNTAMGRWPNFPDYAIWDSRKGDNSLTSNDLVGPVDWTGAEIALFTTTYVVSRGRVESHKGKSIKYKKYGSYSLWQNSTSGYFVHNFVIQNDLRTLDVQNEWYFNPSTRKLIVYSVNKPSEVKVSTLDTLAFTSYKKDYISFESLTFEGAGKNAIELGATKFVSIKNCDINFSGKDAINGSNWGESLPGLIIENCSINNSNGSGINLSRFFNDARISKNVVKNSGMLPMMMDGNSISAKGISAIGPNNIISNNIVDSCGYIGLEFRGSNTVVQNNLVKNFCKGIGYKDGGGIYFWAGNETFSGLKLLNNICMNSGSHSNGIYLDDGANGILVKGNSVANTQRGFYIHNARNVELIENTSFNSTQAELMLNNDNTSGHPMNNIKVLNNIFIAKAPTQRVLWSNQRDDKPMFAPFVSNNNYFLRPVDDHKTIQNFINNKPVQRTLNEWKQFSRQDANSKKSPKGIDDTRKIRFEYNGSDAPITITLPKRYIDAKEEIYNGSVTLQPWTSVILMEDGEVIVNKKPLAKAGTNQIITLPLNQVKLSGSGTDEDGKIVSYAWKKKSGPASFKIENASSATTDVTGLAEGEYVFELEVTDDKGAIATSTVKVTVKEAPNKAPAANAGSNQSITLPLNRVALTGSGIDADGKIVSYSWKKKSGPASFKIINASSATTDVTGLTKGEYVFELEVTDNKGAIATSTVKVTVKEAPNKAPVANAGSNQSITLPLNRVALTGSGTDEDGKIVSYSWSKKSGPASFKIINASSATTDVTGLTKGEYIFELEVTDNKGAIATSTVKVTVKEAPNKAPIANAGSNQSITLPVNRVVLPGSGIDEDGKIVSYSWSKKSGPASSKIINASSATTDVTGLTKGEYVFELEVTDNKGAIATSTVKVTVKEAPNKAPVANAGSNQSIILPSNRVSLNGSGTDEDGTIVSYLWTRKSGPASFKISNATSPVTEVTGLTEGEYVFELEVTDNKGATATSTVKVTVNEAPNKAPVGFAGKDIVITLPLNWVALYGSGTDEDGTISSYNWVRKSGPAISKIINASSPVTEVTDLTIGEYVFELKVTDNKGATATSAVKVTVKEALIGNENPVADASEDITLTTPESETTLYGIGSDIDGGVVKVHWSQVGGPGGATIADPSNYTTKVTNLVAGTYLFELLVEDEMGAKGTDTVEVIVALGRVSSAVSTNGFKIYPNPVNDVANISITSIKLGSVLQLAVLDVQGRVVLQKKIRTSDYIFMEQLQVGNLIKGDYIITVTFNEGDAKTFKMFKL